MQPKVGMEDLVGKRHRQTDRHLGKAVFVIYRGLSKDKPDRAGRAVRQLHSRYSPHTCLHFYPAISCFPLDQDYREGRNPSVLLSVSSMSL